MAIVSNFLIRFTKNNNIRGVKLALNFLINDSFGKTGSFNINNDQLLNKALEYAIKNLNYEIAQLLIHSGAKLSSIDKYGITSLRYAIQNNSDKIIKLLINNGADVNAIDKYGITSLGYAIQNNSAEITKLLIRHGADVNAIDKYGMTPLGYSVRNNSDKIIELLISHGADVNSKDMYGKTPLSGMIENYERALDIEKGTGNSRRKASCKRGREMCCLTISKLIVNGASPQNNEEKAKVLAILNEHQNAKEFTEIVKLAKFYVNRAYAEAHSVQESEQLTSNPMLYAYAETGNSKASSSLEESGYFSISEKSFYAKSLSENSLLKESDSAIMTEKKQEKLANTEEVDLEKERRDRKEKYETKGREYIKEMGKRLENRSTAQQLNIQESTAARPGNIDIIKELTERLKKNYDSGYESDETIRRLSIKYSLSNSDYKKTGQSSYNPSSQVNSVNVEGVIEDHRCK